MCKSIETSKLCYFTRVLIHLYHNGFLTEGTVVLREKAWCKTSKTISEMEKRQSIFWKSSKSSNSRKKEYSCLMLFDIHFFYVILIISEWLSISILASTEKSHWGITWCCKMCKIFKVARGDLRRCSFWCLISCTYRNVKNTVAVK